MEEARKISFLVEKDHDAVFLESHRTAREYLTSKMNMEVAKKISMARFERIRGHKKGSAPCGDAVDIDEEKG